MIILFMITPIFFIEICFLLLPHPRDPKHNGVDYRTTLDSQRGAVLATECKNNGCKLARWTAQVGGGRQYYDGGDGRG